MRKLKKVQVYMLMAVLIVLSVGAVWIILHSHNRENADYWVGTYSFNSFCEPNIMLSSTIRIHKENGKLAAYITNNGFQTLDRLKANVLCYGDYAILEFADYFVDEEGNCDVGIRYEQGDVLLIFKKQSEGFLTVWGWLRPILTGDEFPENHYVKDSDMVDEELLKEYAIKKLEAKG